MSRLTRLIALAALVTIPAAASISAADVDRAAVDFTVPAEIKWVRNAAGGGKVHYDGAKREETVIQVWGMGPATSTPAGKR